MLLFKIHSKPKNVLREKSVCDFSLLLLCWSAIAAVVCFYFILFHLIFFFLLQPAMFIVHDIFSHSYGSYREPDFIIYHFCTLLSFFEMPTTQWEQRREHRKCARKAHERNAAQHNEQTTPRMPHNIPNEFMKFIMWQNLRKFHINGVHSEAFYPIPPATLHHPHSHP